MYTFIQFEINAMLLPRAISPLVETFQTPPRISKQLAVPYLLPKKYLLVLVPGRLFTKLVLLKKNLYIAEVIFPKLLCFKNEHLL